MSLSVRVAATSLKLVLEGHLILGVRAIHPLAPTYRRGYDANVGERTQHPEVLSIRRNTAALAPYLRISLTSEEMSNNIQDISPSILAGA